MMRESNKTEITIETHRTFIVRRTSLTRAWCARCATTVSFASPEEAARLAGRSAREIYRAVEAGRLHFIETGNRLLRVCLDSLLPSGGYAVPARAAERESDVAFTQVAAETVFETVYPDGSTSRKKVWLLTREAFDLLLASLDADRECAARKYETLRAKLFKYFECRGCPLPEDLTDETINRVARRLAEGRQIWTNQPASYFYGVARNVLREYWASPEREFATLDALPALAHPNTDALRQQGSESEHRLNLLGVCLSQLPAESRELILDYYKGERRERIRHRQQIAVRLGIPQNALRIRIHRIRERLERSFSQHLH